MATILQPTTNQPVLARTPGLQYFVGALLCWSIHFTCLCRQQL